MPSGRIGLPPRTENQVNGAKIKLSYNIIMKGIGLLGILFLAGLICFIGFYYDPNAFSNPMMLVLFFMLALTALLFIETFTTWYWVDSVGIHKHSFFTRKNEMRWDEILLIYPEKFDSLIIKSASTKFDISTQFFTGLPYLAAFLKEKVPEDYMYEVRATIDDLYGDYKKLKSGGSQFRISYKHYSPFVALMFFLIGFLIVNDSITSTGQTVITKIGLGGTLLLIGAVLMVYRKKHLD